MDPGEDIRWVADILQRNFLMADARSDTFGADSDRLLYGNERPPLLTEDSLLYDSDMYDSRIPNHMRTQRALKLQRFTEKMQAVVEDPEPSTITPLSAVRQRQPLLEQLETARSGVSCSFRLKRNVVRTLPEELRARLENLPEATAEKFWNRIGQDKRNAAREASTILSKLGVHPFWKTLEEDAPVAQFKPFLEAFEVEDEVGIPIWNQQGEKQTRQLCDDLNAGMKIKRDDSFTETASTCTSGTSWTSSSSATQASGQSRVSKTQTEIGPPNQIPFVTGTKVSL